MKKIILSLVLVLVSLGFVVACDKGPVKEFYEGKTAGNNGFTNFVGNNMDGDPYGWVRYNKDSMGDGCLRTTWHLWGLKPDTEYQLKLESKGDRYIGDLCGYENANHPDYGVWMCGGWQDSENPSEQDSFLVMDMATSNEEGYIEIPIKECRLPSGGYSQMQFIITENGGDWSSAWTWENPEETISEFVI